MIATVWEMLEASDEKALDDLWQLLGGSPGSTEMRVKAGLVTELIHKTCGRGNMFSAERAALDQLADTVGVDPAAHPLPEPLEDAIVGAISRRLEEKLAGMSEEERRRFFEDAVKRMSDEDRIRLIDQVLEGFGEMSDEEQGEFVRQLAVELGLDEAELLKALSGGAAALLPLLLAKNAGFAAFLWTTKIMYVAAGAVGLKLPFAAYMLKNQALGWLLGPVGMLVTTAMSLGWFGVRAWRRKERFRKLVQLVAYCSTWRERRGDAGLVNA